MKKAIAIGAFAAVVISGNAQASQTNGDGAIRNVFEDGSQTIVELNNQHIIRDGNTIQLVTFNVDGSQSWDRIDIDGYSVR